MTTHIGGQTKSAVRLNNSSEFTIIHNPTRAELLAEVDVLLVRGIKEVWGNLFLISKRHLPSEGSNEYLRAFEPINASQSQCKLCSADIKLIATNASITFKFASDAVKTLRSIPLEHQRSALHSLDDQHREVLNRSKIMAGTSREFTSRLLSNQIAQGCTLDEMIKQVAAGRDDWKLDIDAGEDRREQLILIMIRLIAHFCGLGYVLAPASRKVVSHYATSQLTEAFVEEFLASVSESRRKLTDELLGCSHTAYSPEAARKARVDITNFIASTDAKEVGDFSTELLDEYTTCYVGDTEKLARDHALRNIRRVAKVVVISAISKYPLWQISYVTVGKLKRPRQRGKKFHWAERHEYLSEWVTAATTYADAIAGQVTQGVAAINTFLEFIVLRALKGLDTPRNIRELRFEHFISEDLTDAFTLFDYVESLKNQQTGSTAGLDVGQVGKTRRCKGIHNFLESVVRRTPGASNPMSMDDFRFTGRLNKGRTSRIALDDPIVGALKNSVVVFSRNSEGKILKADFPLIAATGDTIEVFDKKLEKWVTVEWPGRSILLYLLLCIPIRTFQARWCDSGVNDAKTYDIESDLFLDNHLLDEGVRPTNNGILRQIIDEATGEKFLGLWINTNKSQVTRGIHGYEIPWISPEITYLVCYLRDWYLRYHVPGAIPFTTPIKFHQGESKEISARTSARFPSFSPLFREIRQIGQAPPYGSVISYKRLRDLYLQALGAADTLLSKSGRLPRRLVEWLVTENGEKVPRVALVDLHTLRVTGITALLDRGVPADIVAEFVAGHATTLMTLHYRNSGPASLRAILKKAQSRFIESQFNSEGYLRLLQDEDYAEEELLKNDEDGAPDNAELYRQSSKTGIYQLTDGGSGVCPGTNCSEGSWDEGAQRAMPVEGGDGACGNCRFWRTGRVFLNGQVARMNELMYEIHNLTLVVKVDRVAVRKKRAELETAQSDNRVRVELHQHESRLKTLEGALSAKLRDWAGRYRKLMKSNRMPDTKVPVGFAVTNNDELVAAAQETSPYVLAQWLCLQAEQAPELGVHPGAQVDLEYAIAKICDRNKLPNFLLKVPRETRLEVANQFVEFLVASENLSQASFAEINSLFEGEHELVRVHGVPAFR